MFIAVPPSSVTVGVPPEAVQSAVPEFVTSPETSIAPVPSMSSLALPVFVTLPVTAVQTVPSDRVAAATLEVALPGIGAVLLAVGIMISTFGCANGLLLTGARAYYAMARDGLFFRSAGVLNDRQVPGWGLVIQGVWASLLVLPRTFNPATGAYGNLYGSLLDYVVSAALLFYILTIAAVFRLRTTRPDVPRPYRAFGYPVVPAVYILTAAAILIVLAIYRASTTWPGFVIVLVGLPVYAWMRRRAGAPIDPGAPSQAK